MGKNNGLGIVIQGWFKGFSGVNIGAVDGATE